MRKKGRGTHKSHMQSHRLERIISITVGKVSRLITVRQPVLFSASQYAKRKIHTRTALLPYILQVNLLDMAKNVHIEI